SFTFTATPPTAIYPLSLHDALPICAFPFCELHGEMANSAAAGMNQHALTWLQLRGVEQRLPRGQRSQRHGRRADVMKRVRFERRSEEHTSELQSRFDLVCRLLLEKK